MTLKHKDGGVNCMDYCPKTNRLAVGSQSGLVQIWDLSGPINKNMKPETKSYKKSVNVLKFSPNGRFLAVGFGDTFLTYPESNQGEVLLVPIAPRKKQAKKK